MKKVMVIMNPTAGGEKSMDYLDAIKSKMSEYFDEVDVRVTEKANDATEFAAIACEEKYESIFAAGGDGTVTEVLSGIAEKDHRPKFGIIPFGTGNLMARTSKLPLDPEGYLEKLSFDTTKKVDIGKCNDKYFGNIFSIGNVSEAIHNVSIEEKTKLGPLAYTINTIKSIQKDRTKEFKITVDGVEYGGNASHIMILLTNYLGNIKLIDNDDDDSDGFMNILILKDEKLGSKLSLIPNIIAGTVEENENVVFLKGKEVLIDSEEDIETDIDGDAGDNLPVKITILNKHIDLYLLKPEKEKSLFGLVSK